MSFAAPAALILGAIALPIVALYILKIRLRRVPVSTNMFWNQVYEEKPPRSLWQHFRHLLSLLAQLLLLSLLVFSVADPVFSWQMFQARKIVAVIDNSASMGAADESQSRFENAIDSAVNFAEGMRFRDKMAIVLAGSRPEVILGMTDHVPTIKRKLRELELSDFPTKLKPAIELANRLVGSEERGQIVLFSDGCDIDFDMAEFATRSSENVDSADDSNDSKFAKLELRQFVSNVANVGITQFQVRRSLIDLLGYEVLVSVKNASDEPVACRVEIELDELPVDVIPLKLQPNETWSRSLEKTSREGGHLHAKLVNFEPLVEKDDDGQEQQREEKTTDQRILNALLDDDSAWALLPEQRTQKVLVISEGNWFLQKVFEANPLVDVSVANEIPETFPSDTLIVFHRLVPKTMPKGNFFVIDPTESCDLWELGEVAENPIVTNIDSTSDIMTHVRLDNVIMPEARKLKLNTEHKVLAGTISEDTVIAEFIRDSGKGVVLTVNLEKSDLAFRTAFPILVTNALGWFAGSSGELRESLATGETTEYEIEELIKGQEFLLKSPTGNEKKIQLLQNPTFTNVVADEKQSTAQEPANSGIAAVGPFDEVGIWSLVSPAAQNDQPDELIAEFAVNLSNDCESDLRPLESNLLSDSSSRSGWFARPVWYYLIAVATLFFVVEWFLYQRRFIS